MFKFKGISSEYFGVRIANPNALITKASQRHEIIQIDGRDGGIFQPLGYDLVTIQLILYVEDVVSVDDMLGWLNGKGVLEYKGRETEARMYAELSPFSISNVHTFEVDITRDPFWYKINDTFTTVTSNIRNQGSTLSKPIIRLQKRTSQIVELRVGGVQFEYDFKNDLTVDIDCEELGATQNGMPRNKQLRIGYDFPQLQVGDNTLQILRGNATIQVKNESRWL